VLIAAFDATPGPFIALMALGFLVGTAGHVYKANTAIVIGIGLIFMATLGLPLAIYFSAE
jgi:hypothetical protein